MYLLDKIGLDTAENEPSDVSEKKMKNLAGADRRRLGLLRPGPGLLLRHGPAPRGSLAASTLWDATESNARNTHFPLSKLQVNVTSYIA